jgi:hypothetical protein
MLVLLEAIFLTYVENIALIIYLYYYPFVINNSLITTFLSGKDKLGEV